MIIIIIDITLVNYILLFHHKVVFNVCSFTEQCRGKKEHPTPELYLLYNQVLVTFVYRKT